MYRVSSKLRTKVVKQGCLDVVKVEKEQCGSFYYFHKKENAIKAFLEFETSIDVVTVNTNNTQDHWYE